MLLLVREKKILLGSLYGSNGGKLLIKSNLNNIIWFYCLKH